MKPSRWSLFLVVSVAVVAAGCGGDDGSGDAGEPVPTPPTGVTDDTVDDVDEPSIDGDWVLSSGNLDGDALVLVDGRDVTMSLDGDQVGGTAACNGYGGTVAVGDEFELGGSFVVGELSWTEMGCEPAVMDVEQQFLTALGEIESYELAETLSLGRTGVSTSLTFVRIAPVDDEDLVGTTWRLDTLISGEAATNVGAMDAAFLEFRDEGTLAGSTGCRRLEGEWVLQGATVQIPTLSAIDDPTAGRCAPESEALDSAIIAIVEAGMTVEVDGSRLTLTAPGGDGLSFVADGARSGSASSVENGVESDESAALDPAGGVDGEVVYGAHRAADGGEEALIEGALSYDGSSSSCCEFSVP